MCLLFMDRKQGTTKASMNCEPVPQGIRQLPGVDGLIHSSSACAVIECKYPQNQCPLGFMLQGHMNHQAKVFRTSFCHGNTRIEPRLVQAVSPQNVELPAHSMFCIEYSIFFLRGISAKRERSALFQPIQRTVFYICMYVYIQVHPYDNLFL